MYIYEVFFLADFYVYPIYVYEASPSIRRGEECRFNFRSSLKQKIIILFRDEKEKEEQIRKERNRVSLVHSLVRFRIYNFYEILMRVPRLGFGTLTDLPIKRGYCSFISLPLSSLPLSFVPSQFIGGGIHFTVQTKFRIVSGLHKPP